MLKDGDLRNLPGSKYLRTLTREIGDTLADQRTKKTPEELKKALLDLLKIRIPTKAPYYRKLRQRSIREGLFRNRFGLETEKDSVMCVLASYAYKIV